MPNNDPKNSKKAWGFLKAFFNPDAPVNLIAIDPDSGEILGITRNVLDKRIYQFIERNNGEKNLYFMVNTPCKNAPDNKLKKEHVEFINGVWIDADPVKDNPFDEERIRLKELVEDLKKSTYAPTYIIDSGGGFQAFWLLKKPVQATSENIELYEAYSRGLAAQYNTDNVQNIDRIMRIPYTWNLPTAKKKALKRKKAKANVLYAETRKGIRYD